jgi:hypothetical protein
MNFQCKELSISDEELGCAVSFSDSKTSEDQFKTIEEILNSNEKYLLIQRTYPEDEYEFDYYHIESSETDTELNSKDKMIVKLSLEKFEIDWSGDHLEIGLNLTDIEMKNLKEILVTRFNNRIRFIK